MTYTIGLTGRAGSGKTFLQSLLDIHFSVTIIDLDSLGHYLLTKPSVQKELVFEFGKEILASDGTVDRGVLGEKVFSDPAQLTRLNQIMHPQIKELVISFIATSPRPVVIVGALLDEIELIDLCDVIVTISADESSVDPSSKRYRILKHQRSTQDYEKQADYVLYNSFTPIFEHNALSLFRSILQKV